VPRRLAPLLALLALAGCGSESADLFAVDRSGDLPGAQLRMVVNDGGTVSCNGEQGVALGPEELLEARELQDDLVTPAERGLALDPGPKSLLRYRVTTPDGVVRFADTSERRPPALDRLAFFVRRVARERCGLQR
jgi:hypothetical protein